MQIRPNLPQTQQKKYDPDFGRAPEEGPSDSVKLGVAAGWVGLTTAAGAYLGHQRGLGDQVTIERIPYAETTRVVTGSHVEHGCYQYHYGYDFSSGDWGYHYGYDSSCTQTVTDYANVPTGRTLYREVAHHSKGFPHSTAQGALLGFGVGVATGVAGLVLANVIEKG